jgi:hypothetical protein
MADKPKSGRPLIYINIANLIEEIIIKNSTLRSFSYSYIAAEVASKLGVEKDLYAKSVFKILKAKKYKSYKQIIKPGLIKEMKDARWKWYLEHKDWIME